MDHDQDLYRALSEAVDHVEPTDRLVRIRQETRRNARRRRTWFATGAVGLAVASVVTIALVSSTSSPRRAAEPAEPSQTPSQTPTDAPDLSPDNAAYPVYYVGPGPDGPDGPEHVLYLATETGADVVDVLMQTPTDPDYRTLWPEGSLLDVLDAGEFVLVDLADESLADRPDGMSPAEARLALQQVAYTVHAVLGTDAPLLFEFPGGGDAETVYGISTDLVGRAPALTVLSHMSIDTPAEGAVVSRDAGPLVVSGRGNSFEASGACFLRDDAGLGTGPYLAQMAGYMAPRLFPWELSVDLTDIPPGTYTLACLTDDPTGGAEGRGTDTDTRTVIIE